MMRSELLKFSINLNRLNKNSSILRLRSVSNCLTFSTRRRDFSSGGGASVTSKLDYRVVFLGSDNFSVPSLATLLNILKPENISVVVANHNNFVGKVARARELKTFLWEEYKTLDVGGDFGVVASFGYLIPKRVIDRFPMGILNVHASLLPRWRGAAPIAHAIMNGDDKTGISIMQIAPHRFDVGPILHQKEVPLHPHIRRPELTTLLSNLGADGLTELISDLNTYLKKSLSQEGEGRLSRKLVPDLAKIDWHSMSALNVYNRFRGLYGTFKLKTVFHGKLVDLDDIALISEEFVEPPPPSKSSKNFDICTNFTHYYQEPCVVHINNSQSGTEKSFKTPESAMPGQIVFYNDMLLVKCHSGENESSNSHNLDTKYLSWISIKKVKIGNKWMNAKDFRNGFLSKVKSGQHLFQTDHCGDIYEGKIDKLNDKSVTHFNRINRL